MGTFDHVSFPAMIGSDYCIVVSFNIIYIQIKKILLLSCSRANAQVTVHILSRL